MVYTVGEMLEDLEGHDLDREIKLLLTDGNKVPVVGVKYLNSMFPEGDDIIYLVEENEDYRIHGDSIKMFVQHGYPMAQKCNLFINSEYADTDFALEMITQIALEADEWLRILNIEHDFENGTGPDNEVYDKINLLNDWIKKFDKNWNRE